MSASMADRSMTLAWDKSTITWLGSLWTSNSSFILAIDQKKIIPLILYTLVFPSNDVWAARDFHFSRAKMRAESTIPRITAVAKSTKIVTTLTTMMTKRSLWGIFPLYLRVSHSNVEITTINMSHTRLARGMLLTIGHAKRMKKSSHSEATIHDNFVLPHDLILMIDCPIIASPPIHPKNPLMMLAIPCARYSLFICPLVSVMSSITLSVNVASVRPTNAATKAYGKIMRSVSNVHGTCGRWNPGSAPINGIPAKSCTVWRW